MNITVNKWKYFMSHELQCRCNKCDSTGHEMKPELMEPLIVLRGTMNFPFLVSSAYRCPSHNNKVSKTGFEGPHTTGLAIDIVIGSTPAYYFLEAAYAMKVFTGIGINQKGAVRFIHLDVLDPQNLKYTRPMLWSY